MKDLKRLDLCDSISQNQSLQIINFKDVLKKDEQIIQLNSKRLSEVEKSLSIANIKVKVLKRVSLFGIPIAITGGFILGIVVFN